jgi:peptide/nickel transport system substrate-binding protein
MGTGSGFTAPAPMYMGRFGSLSSITAVSDYDVVFKFSTNNAAVNMWTMFEPITQQFSASEWVEQSDPADYHNVVGNGAWILTDYVSNSAMTLEANPNYYGRDERYPENQFPYLDSVKILAIPDITTAVASLRTGKLDMLTKLDYTNSSILAENNPEIEQAAIWESGVLIQLRCDKAPFTDIKVRQALNMAIDRQAVAKSYYGGSVEGTPAGAVSPEYKEYSTLYKEWSADLQEGYSYNVDKAKQLLKEAGYPDGFKTNIVTGNSSDMNFLQIIKAQFLDIGVDMEIKSMETTVAQDYVRALKHDQMYYTTSSAVMPPTMSLVVWASYESNNVTENNDPVYDAIVEEFQNAVTLEDARAASKKADLYYASQYWCVETFPVHMYQVWQPYVKGYSGEQLLWGRHTYWTRFWINSD